MAGLTALPAALERKADRLQAQAFTVISPAPRAWWGEVLTVDPDAIVSQTPTWLDCLCATGDYADASRAYEWPDGRRLLLPMVRRRHWPAALTMQASQPDGWGIGGLLGTQAITRDDVTAVMTDLLQQGALRTCIRPNPLSGAIWTAAQLPGVQVIPRLAHVLDLSGGFDRVWTQRFSSATRNKIRKAERSGLVVECDTTGRLVPIFYGLFLQSIERWAQQQHEPPALARWRATRRDPLRKFQLLAQQLGEACRIRVAWLDRQPVAAMMVLQDKNAHYTRGAMDKTLATSTRANDLLQRLAIEDACRAGCRTYHMGESGVSTTLANFKERFGAEACSYAEYRVERWPITQIDRRLRGLVKRLIGFRDV
ncbi:MAG: GNAT family N-acetyltransferase [Chloroflexi bacterium]|nr:GNAT family N-acetyltransferase [Chloroflexota bacterium]